MFCFFFFFWLVSTTALGRVRLAITLCRYDVVCSVEATNCWCCCVVVVMANEWAALKHHQY